MFIQYSQLDRIFIDLRLWLRTYTLSVVSYQNENEEREGQKKPIGLCLFVFSCHFIHCMIRMWEINFECHQAISCFEKFDLQKKALLTKIEVYCLFDVLLFYYFDG